VSDALLYKGVIYQKSPREEKASKIYIDENMAKGSLEDQKKLGELRLCMD